MKNALTSISRVSATGKYLLALTSAPDIPANGDHSIIKNQIPSPWRRQLHILYLLNDLLHHTKYHLESSSTFSALSTNLQSVLIDIFTEASKYERARYPSHNKKSQDLLELWERKGYYQASYISKLREFSSAPASPGDLGNLKPRHDVRKDEPGEALTARKDAPYIMPASHGDPSTPYFDLPAGNLVPHIIPNSTVPINPQQVKPLQFVPKPADESLMRAVKNFMKDVEFHGTLIGSEKEGVEIDIDELGQPIIREEIGDSVRGEGYYGWSKVFCERMKRRRNGRGIMEEPSRGSDNVDRSAVPRKRRRYSSSEESRRSYPSSRSMSRSPQFRSRSGPHSPRSISYSPPPIVSSSQQHQSVPIDSTVSLVAPQLQASSHHLSVTFPPGLARGFPLGPDGLPIPPRPPNYKGPWPPPPPPLPQGRGQTPQGIPLSNFPSFIPPPPPPVGPRASSNFNSPPLPLVMNGPQGQMPGSSIGWCPQQHAGYPASTMQAPYNGYYPTGTAREHRGGWG